jgi:hypothetical protein
MEYRQYIKFKTGKPDEQRAGFSLSEQIIKNNKFQLVKG